MTKTVTLLTYVFLMVGAGLLAGAFLFYRDTAGFLDTAVRADGTVIELAASRSSSGSTTYRPVVRFTASRGEAIEFTSSAGSNPPGYSEGDAVGVLYPAGSPRRARIDGFFSLWGAPLIFGGIGSVFFLIPFGIIATGRMKARRDAYLRRNGISIDTTFQSVALNESLSVNGRHPYVVLSQWQDPATSRVHVFQSGNVWYDPSSYLTGNPIKVFIQRNDPSKYVVDLSFLPELAG